VTTFCSAGSRDQQKDRRTHFDGKSRDFTRFPTVVPPCYKCHEGGTTLRRPTAFLFTLLAFATSARPQNKSDSVTVFVTGLDDADAAPVVRSLVKKLNDSKPFEAVTKKEDPSKVVVMITCMSRQQTDPFACMYVSHYHGAIFNTFLGGGIFLNPSPEAVASKFFASIAQDVVERYNNAFKDNYRHTLESCLFLTDSKCNVHDQLQKELGEKPLTLGRYVLKTNQ
jgi:hypothetical protein